MRSKDPRNSTTGRIKAPDPCAGGSVVQLLANCGAEMTRPRKGRPYPYFKVQWRDPSWLAWRDHRREAFSTLKEAQAYRDTLPSEYETRIVRWDEDGSSPLPD